MQYFFPFFCCSSRTDTHKHLFVFWHAEKQPHTIYCTIKYSSNHKCNHTLTGFLQATKRRKKGGSNVALSVFLAAPCFWYSAKHGSLKALNYSTFKKPQRGKAVLHRPDVDSFRWKDSWCVYVTVIIVYLWFPSGNVVRHFHLMCCCDING